MGQLLSGGTTRPASSSDLEAYDRMREQQAKQAVPALQRSDHAARIFVHSSHYGPSYLDRIFSGGISSNNFPGLAEVAWRSKDGEAHRDYIDVDAIFADRLVRHNVPREHVRDLPNGKLNADSRISGYPEIILEVNDRTIRIYMRASIPLKGLKNPRKPWDGFREDLILVRTDQY